MSHPPDVDWLGESRPDDESRPAEDTLELRGLPRWVRVAGGLVVAAVVALGVVVAVRHGGSGDHHRAGAPTAGTTDGSAVSAPAAFPAVLPSPAPVRPAGAVATDGRVVFVLRSGQLRAVRDGRTLAQVAVTGFADATVAATAQLVSDAATRTVWAVGGTGSLTTVVRFAAGTLHRQATAVLHVGVQNAAALDGVLYLSTPAGVVSVGGIRHVRVATVAGLDRANGWLAGDPRRHRLLAMDLGLPSHVWSYRPGHATVEGPDALGFEGGTVVVAGDDVWVSGHAEGASLIERLDPVTLEVLPETGVGVQVGPGAIAVSGGTHAIWVTTDRGDLVCADGHTGRPQQSWGAPYVSSVITVGRTAYATSDERIFALPLSRCLG